MVNISQCKKKYHTLLHKYNDTGSNNADSIKKCPENSNEKTHSDLSNTTLDITSSHLSFQNQSVLLALVWVEIESENGRSMRVRALIKYRV